MYEIKYSNRFKREFKKCMKRGFPIKLFEQVVTILAAGGTLPAKNRAHKLSGDYAGLWECHITPDWLLIWEENDNELVILLVATGTHSDLF